MGLALELLRQIVLEWYFGPSCLPTFTTELSALDRISALDFKLEKVYSLISEIQSQAGDKFFEETGLTVS